MPTNTELTRRLARMESRIVRGFEGVGVDVTRKSGQPMIQVGDGVITVDSLNVTLSALFAKRDELVLDSYAVFYDDQIVCHLLTRGIPNV